MNLRKQRRMGAVLVVISVVILVLASMGTTPEEQDATAVLFLLPLGIWMLCTKEYLLYDEAEQEAQPRASPGKHRVRRYTHIQKGATSWQEKELLNLPLSTHGEM